MHPDKYVVLALNGTLHQCNVLLPVENILVDITGEIHTLGRNTSLGDSLDQLFCLTPIANEFRD